MSLENLIEKQDEHNDQYISGVVVGVITNNKDPESLGRVKVKFPWRGEEEESFWARIASLMAGNERGMVFYPEVDDEVLVAFEHGDINQPYVIGALWNGEDKPPETNSDGKNNIKKIKSRNGHEIIFNDEESSEKLEIISKSGHKITFDDKESSEKLEIISKSEHKIILDDSSGAEKIEIKDKTGSNYIVIDSAENSITIESTGKLSMKSQKIDIEASGMMNIKAGGNLTIEGSLVKIN